MASLDLRATFDIVNVDVLLKRLVIMGLPGDKISLKITKLKIDLRFEI